MIRERLALRWHAEGGYREVLTIALPLIISTGSWSLLHFIDRMFLAWYSQDTIAAAMPSGVLYFAMMSVFLGTAAYVSTFVSQYHGAKHPDRIGPSVWQGIYISMLGGVLLLAVAPFARHIFAAIGHDPAVQKHEAVYFSVICLGAFPTVGSAALAGFFSGRGKTMPVMWVSVIGTVLNIILDYIMIFGKLGCPELGIKGAAIATVISSSVRLLIFGALFLGKTNNRQFNTRRGWRLNTKLFARLIRYGLPSGLQFFVDVAGFAFFILLVGRLGKTFLAASNIAFSINNLAFMPIVGIGMAISVLVGQNLGRNDPDTAERTVYSGFHIAVSYMLIIGSLFVLAPSIFIWCFTAGSREAYSGDVGPIVVVLLRFIAVFVVFDAMCIVFAAAIKGAGDTRFVMKAILVFSLGALVLPSYIVFERLHMSIYAGFVIITVYVMILGTTFFLRFFRGKWKTMRVIEQAPVGAETGDRHDFA